MAKDEIVEKVLLRGSTAKEAQKNNILLLAKEVGIETDTYRMKLGDGIRKWNQLPYLPYSIITQAMMNAWNTATTGNTLFQNSAAFNITNGMIAQWNSAITVETDPIFAASAAATITAGDINNWNNPPGGIAEDDIIAYAVAL